MTHLHSEFHLKMSMYDEDNARKLNILVVLGPTGNYLIGTKFEIDTRILVTHLYSIFHLKIPFVMEIRAVTKIGSFLSPRDIILQKKKYINRNQIRT